MNTKHLIATICLLLLLSTTGCIIPKGYIDPTFRTASYQDVNPKKSPVPVRVEYTFLTNDSPSPRATQILEKKANRVLESTKVFRPDPNAKATLKIQMANIADMGKAFTKGFGTGLTFGLVGSSVVDRYVMKVEFRSADEVFDRSYDHALHSTIGIKSAPKGMQPVSYADAFDQIVEDLLLRYLVDYQHLQQEKESADLQSVSSVESH